jgi:3-deoxy-manno-octulosonate cytidylyltransferase (CMP-KDO synthetase)
MKTAIIIPARYASTRFPAKPLFKIKGKYLIQRVLEQALKCKTASLVACATDDERIYNAVKNLGFNAFMTPKNLKSGTDRIAYTAKNYLKNFSVFLNVQGDEPLADPELMSKLISELQTTKTLDMVTAAVEIKKAADFNNPNVVKTVLDKNSFAMYFSRQAIPFVKNGVSRPKIYKHMGIYGYRRDFLLKFSALAPTPLEKAESLEQLRALENGYKIKAVISKKDSIGVDTLEDAKKVEKLLNGNKNK